MEKPFVLERFPLPFKHSVALFSGGTRLLVLSLPFTDLESFSICSKCAGLFKPPKSTSANREICVSPAIQQVHFRGIDRLLSEP